MKRRNFLKISSVPYPDGIGHEIFNPEVKLCIYLRAIKNEDQLTKDQKGNGLILPPHWRGVQDKK